MEARTRTGRALPDALGLPDLLRLACDLDAAGLRRLWLIDTVLGAGCEARHLLDIVVRLEDFVTGGAYTPLSQDGMDA